MLLLNEYASTQFLSLVISSSVLSAILTSFVSWRIHYYSYRNDYYKKILDKRIEAYEHVQRLLSMLKGSVQINGKGVCILYLSLGHEKYTDLLFNIISAIHNSFWISDETGEMLTELNVFMINSIDNALDENDDLDAQLVELGIKFRDEIRSRRFNIENQLYKDFSTLHKIEKFAKPKTPKQGHILHDKPNRLQKQI